MASSIGITWLGHGTFVFRSPAGKRLLIDPWLAGNPKCPAAWHRPSSLDAILITHAHGDHMGDAVAAARATGAPVVANYEICTWLAAKGVKDVRPMNTGGRQVVAGVEVVMTDARHSSSVEDGGRVVALGEAGGFILRFEGGPTVYFAGDTGLFGDMKLIRELYAPDIACLPIGDLFTMGPEDAARAADWLGVRQVVPMHWGTFPVLTGTPAQLKALVGPRGVEVVTLAPGETAE